MTKKPTPKRKPPSKKAKAVVPTLIAIDPATVSIDPDELLRTAAAAVKTKLTSAVEFREVARLSEAMASIAHQARQASKQTTRELRAIPVDQIVAFLKTLPEEQRVDIGRELAGFNDEESLL